jgi:uncharacterized protein YoxC
MTGIVLLSVFAAICLLRIVFVLQDIRDVLHKVHSTMDEHMRALKAVSDKLDGLERPRDRTFNINEWFDASEIVRKKSEQHDREFAALQDLLKPTVHEK